MIRMSEPDPYTPYCDVYSFGVVIYELITSQLPYSHCMQERDLVSGIIDIRGFTGLETPNELHNRGALTDAHAHAALIILMAVKGDQYSLLSRQLK